ncbi:MULTISPECIES: cytochrome c3 family protein [unclassified Adlercreutzia]|uniref:cytochrome c3 family protein n=1 Tax=unclassified Adlercreutzia TaxID=2636013 RepID=UPI001F14CD78|nr:MULTISPECIES: cytochrome c3 family protein [unclassified Adlercreutzia]
MSEDNKKVNEGVNETSEEAVANTVVVNEGADASPENKTEAAPAAPNSKAAKRRKRGITIGVICAIVIVAGAGFWVWHEQPSFCNAICHSPMDPALETYEGKSGESGVDKWGNSVEDMGTLMVVQHKESADMVCLDCHVPTIDQQMGEVVHWVGGTYDYPLNECSLTDLNAYRKLPNADEFCLNEGCHNMTRDDLARATGGQKYNPHVTIADHRQLECSDCHKAHRQSVMACTRCHDEAKVPEGWLSAEQSAEITSANFNS